MLVVAVLGLVLVNGGVRPYVEKANAAADSRVQAVDWLAANVQPDQRVFVASEVAVAEEELERIPGEVVVAPSLDGVKQLPIDVASYDVVVTAQFKDLEPVSPAPPPPDVVFGRKRPAAVPKPWQGVDLLMRSASPKPEADPSTERVLPAGSMPREPATGQHRRHTFDAVVDDGALAELEDAQGREEAGAVAGWASRG